MKKINKIIRSAVTLLLAASMLLSVGCGNTATDKTGEYAVTDYMTGVNLAGKTFDIIKDGIARYDVVIPSEASDKLALLVSEMNEYFIQMTGTWLQMYRDNEYTGDKYISIGDTEQSKKNNIDISEVENDGFVIKNVGDNFFIKGKEELGAQNGVYSFLERFAGIRWLTSTETYIPETSTITARECDILENPEFAMRDWMIAGYLEEEFAAHRRFLRAGDYFAPQVAESHNTTDQEQQPGIGYVNKSDIDPADPQGRTLGESHPEYFSDYTNTTATDYDICFTNGVDDNGELKEGQSVASLLIDKIKRFLTEDKDTRNIKYIMIGRVDNRNANCQCETCNERKELYGHSGISVILMNLVEEKINEWLMREQGRTVGVVMLAYHQTQNPPVNTNADGSFSLKSPLVKANKNVMVRIAPIDANFTYSYVDERQDEVTRNALNGWAEVTDKFMIWDYQQNYVEYLWYLPTTHYLKENLRYFKSIGAEYLMIQGSYSQKEIWQSDMRAYIASKLFWDFDWDIEYLMNEFLTLYYGEAASYVRRIIDLYENHYREMMELPEDSGFRVQIQQEQGVFLGPQFAPIGWLNKILNTAESAIEFAENSDSISESERATLVYRLEAVMLYPMRMILKNYDAYYPGISKLNFAKEFYAIVDKHNFKYLGETSFRTVEMRKAEDGVI